MEKQETEIDILKRELRIAYAYISDLLKRSEISGKRGVEYMYGDHELDEIYEEAEERYAELFKEKYGQSIVQSY